MVVDVTRTTLNGGAGRPRVVKPGAGISTWSEQKWVRGIAHIGAMSEVATAWDAAGHVWVDLALSEDGYHIDTTLRVDAAPPLEEMALRLGDAVHNFRSALDSLVWSLCHLDGKTPANPRSVQFPCASTDKQWRAAAGGLSSMPPDFLERIRQVQPLVVGPESPLSLLVAMSNQDKHRGMITGAADAGTFNLDIYTGGRLGTRNGITNGVRVDLLHPTLTLTDGLPFAHIECSVPVELNYPRQPVGLTYNVHIGDRSYPLAEVQRRLLSLQQVMIFITQGTRDAPGLPTEPPPTENPGRV